MSLSRYFAQQPIGSISAHARMRVYSDFLTKKQRQSTSRWSQVMKSKKIRQTSMVILSGMVLLASSFLLQTQTPTSTMADNIGEISKQNGVDITSNGRKITSNSIQLYDIIDIADKGTVTIRMANGFDVNVPGPARFTIVPSVENTDLGSYTIKFFTSDNYVAVNAFDTNKENIPDKRTVSIETDGVLFQPQRDDREKISFIIDNKTSSKTTVINKWWSDILATSSTENHASILWDNQSPTIIASAQVTEITTRGTGADIAIVASTSLGSWSIIVASGEDTIKKNTTTKTAIVKIPLNIRTISANGKIILLDGEVDSLKSNMEQSFVKRDIDNISYEYLMGNKAWGNIVRDNLIARMDRINKVIGDNTYTPGWNTLKDLIEYWHYLIRQQTKFENIPYRVTRNMEAIVSRLELLKVYPSWAVKNMFSGDVQPSLDDIFEKAWVSAIILEQNNYIFRK